MNPQMKPMPHICTKWRPYIDIVIPIPIPMPEPREPVVFY
jgi:hypothetical protein